MFFDGIGIDLHFIHEGNLNSENEVQVFRAYENAGQCVSKDNNTVLSAFLLNENGSILSKYESPGNTDNAQREHVVLESTHTCDHTRFMGRIWRVPSVFGSTVAHNALPAEQVVLRVSQQAAPGRDAKVLYETQPVAFEPNRASIWIDAGVLQALPRGDISVTVDRPSLNKMITAIFKPQPSFGTATAFPGVPTDLNGGLNPRHVILGSEEERQLQTNIKAYMAMWDFEQRNSPSVHAQVPPASNGDTRLAHVPFTQVASSTSNAGPSHSGDNTFQTLLSQGSSVDGTNTHAPAPTVAAQVPSNATASSSQSLSPGQQSPALPSRAWSAITRAASSLAPIRNGPHGTSSPGADHSAGTRTTFASQDGQGTMHTSAAEQRVTDAQEGPIANVNAATSEQGSQIIEPLGALLDEVCDVLREAECDTVSAAWAEQAMSFGSRSQLVEQGMQTDGIGGTSRVVGVSYTEDSNLKTSVGPSSQGVQPLVLPSGSGTLAVTLNNDEEMPSSSYADSGKRHPTTDADNQSNDVRMEEPEAQNSAETSGSSSAILAATTQVEQAGARASADAVTNTNRTPQTGNPVATPDDEVQYISCSSTGKACLPDAAAASTNGDAVPQRQRSASVAGTVVLARNTQSRLASASQASNSALRRAGSHRSSASPTPSSRSRHSSFPFQPELERVNEIVTYLCNMVTNDRLKDDQECLQLSESRAKVSDAYEQAVRQYEEQMNTNDLQMQMARARLQLKNDTIRMLCSQYRQEMAQKRFRSRTVEGSRIGSARRSRSRSRISDRTRHTSVAAGRMSAPPSIMPSTVSAQLIKGKRIESTAERIDLTGDDDDGAGPSNAAAYASRRLGEGARSVAHGSRVGSIKIGDVNDLLVNPPVNVKSSKSVSNGVDGNGPARSQAGTASFPGIRNSAVREWMSVVSRSRNASRAATPAAGIARASRDASNSNMPPPSTPFADQGQLSTPIVIGDDDENPTPSLIECRRLVREGKQRQRSVSRAPSVASQRRHRAPTPYARSRVGSVPAASSAPINLTQEDPESDTEGESEEPLFMGQRAASVATSRFSELVDE